MAHEAGKLIFFNGTVMRGQPAHSNLTGAEFLCELTTAPNYRLYSIQDVHPAMLPATNGDGVPVTGEVYFVPDPVWPHIDETEPAGLYRGRVVLLGGEEVYGMLGTPELIAEKGKDISRYGDWREYLGR